jgi:iron complex transport system ATP-binding protein
MRPILEARNIGVTIGSSCLLVNVNVDVLASQVLAVVGPNGREVVGLKPLDLARLRSVLPQQTQSMFSFTAREVVEMGRFAAIDGLNDQAMVERCLTRTQSLHLGHRSFPSLSGGEQTLVNLARVLAQNTPVQLLDEPTAALDIAHQELICEVARLAAETGVAVVVVLHELNLAARIADQILLLNHGVVTGIGCPRDVLRADLLSATYEHPIQVIDHPFLVDTPLVVPMPTAKSTASLTK